MSFILEAVRAQNQLPLLQGWETEHRDHVHPVLDVVLVDSGKYKKKKNTQKLPTKTQEFTCN